MRAQRTKVKGLEAGGADQNDIIIAKARYQGQLAEYKKFSDAMGLKPHMERVYIDGLGRIAMSDKAFKTFKENDIIKRELRQVMKQGKLNVPARLMPYKNLSFDDAHINGERGHSVTKQEALDWIRNASFSMTVWHGHYERYYSHEGAVYVDMWEKKIRTAYRKDEFKDNVKQSMEVMKKHDR